MGSVDPSCLYRISPWDLRTYPWALGRRHQIVWTAGDVEFVGGAENREIGHWRYRDTYREVDSYSWLMVEGIFTSSLLLFFLHRNVLLLEENLAGRSHGDVIENQPWERYGNSSWRLL